MNLIDDIAQSSGRRGERISHGTDLSPISLYVTASILCSCCCPCCTSNCCTSCRCNVR